MAAFRPELRLSATRRLRTRRCPFVVANFGKNWRVARGREVRDSRREEVCFGAFWALSSRLEARYPLSSDYDGLSQPLLRWGARVIFFSLGTNGLNFLGADGRCARGGGKLVRILLSVRLLSSSEAE